MLAQNYFYHKSIRRYTILFGSIFDGFKILDGTKYIDVPLKYGSGYVYVKSPDQETRKEKTPIFPHMTFRLVDITYDEERKCNSQEKIIRSGEDQITSDNRLSVYNRVPYTLAYALTIRTKTTDEALQIAEQIIPYFTPSITFEIKDMDDGTEAYKNLSIEPIQNIPVILRDVSFEDEDNILDTLKFKEWTMTFDLKGYLYKEVLNTPYILEITENYKEFDTEEILFTRVTT